jgi:type IV pilus assembly protein PilC
MTSFRYRARTVSGALVRGTLRADDAGSAAAGLWGRALYVTAVEPERRWAAPIGPLRARSGQTRSRVAFFRCFATLITAGVPLRRALTVALERCDDRALHAALLEVRTAVERGDALSSALARRPHEFSPLVVAMVAAGETGGILDEVLGRIATFLERDHDLRKRVLATLAYPVTVLAAALALVGFLIVRVVPMFSALFASFHVALPPTTAALLAAGDVLGRPAGWIGASVLAALLPASVALARRSARGRRALDRLRFRIPVAGRLVRTAIAARLARTLGTLVHAGVDLNAALNVLAPVAGSDLHADALTRVAIAIREGETLTAPLAASGLFDPMLVALAGVGEETGMLDSLLVTAADYFEADVAATIATLGAVVEPTLIVILGALVALIVSSVFIPLYSLIGGVAQ